ncbi:bifunctional metallophosphatase/5'-nucleotidase [Parashewanella curva]|uniref:Bifunctional metallophosphatase/5'-nucleotidase n=1 Tax=Parashewanella curva TaxID=2338552 RepID=A0A3L8PZR1_9GAMM|nr:bifunctional metallophosphatase/5'-nucleotidase [Parashewanella curva]RLV60650.1 bifunctional metallophosphatase/5'-nucleotidase [Parashewanella curva]
MKTNFIKGLVATAVLAALTGCGNNNDSEPSKEVREGQPLSLSVIHMNDTHSNFDPVKADFKLGQVGSTVFTEFGGYPRLLKATDRLIAESQEKKQPSLVLHGGDAWQGTIYFQLNKGKANAALLKEMKIDAMAFGNHEFDLSTSEVKDFVDAINFPIVAANVDTSEDSALAGNDNIKPYQLFAFKGAEKRSINAVSEAKNDESILAVVGVALEDMPKIADGTGDLAFSKEIESTQKVVDSLKEKGVNKVVVLSHIGLKKDILLAEGTTGVDLIVGGHSHTLLGDYKELGYKNEGTYAQQITQKDGKSKTCIVQAGDLAQAIGRAEVKFDKEGNLLSCMGNNTLLSDDEFFDKERRTDQDLITGYGKDLVNLFIDAQKVITREGEDEALRATIDANYKPEYIKALGRELAKIENTIKHFRRPTAEDKHGSKVAPLVAQSFLDWANKAEIKQLTNKTVHIALAPAGGVRTHLNAVALWEGQVTYEMLPFKNSLSIVELTGSQIKTLLESVITPVLDPAEHAGKFPYVAGMRYTYKQTEKLKEVDGKKVGKGEISVLQLNTGTLEQPVWENIEANKAYNVVLDQYHANGRDGWTEIAKAQNANEGKIRFDIAKKGDAYSAFKVKELTFNATKKKYYPVFDGEALKCRGSVEVNCAMDSEAFIQFADKLDKIEPIAYPMVTMEYLK